ncbi:MAG: hypothetical protein QOE01_2933 [Actinomycetota bacterium]|nr:hypothetical protein [Actinomycetota bacterium]
MTDGHPIGRAGRGYLNRFLVVSNAAAGSSHGDRVAAAVEVLRAGAEVREERSDSPADLERILRDRGDATVVIAGGDGSVHAAVAALRRLAALHPGSPLGLVPLGTGNDLARTLGVPLDPEQAARVVLAGRPRRLDLVVDDVGGVVVNAVHLGIGAEAAARAGDLKDRLGPTAYAVGSAVAGLTERGWALRVEADGAVLQRPDERVLMVAVANGRTIGGGAELAPDADPGDGLLDVVVARSTGPVARLGFGVTLRSGDHVHRADVTVTRASTVRVSGEPFPINADGELAGPVSARSWALEPGAWSVISPPA